MQDYKGYKIYLEESTGMFKARPACEGNPDFSSEKLSDLKRKIDDAEKKKLNLKAYRKGYDEDAPQEVTITSVTQEHKSGGYDVFYAWISWNDGASIHRTKVTFDSLYKSTKENKKIVGEMVELAKQKYEIDKKLDGLRDKLSRHNPKDLGYTED